MNYRNFKKGFTLIELLIVVAIIAILAAIAVPNFLEAQTRSKVSRVLSDMRTLATAIETYRVDNNAYPPTQETPTEYPDSPFNQIGGGYFAYAGRLTTPTSYISNPPHDLFSGQKDVPGYGWDLYEYWSEPTVGFDIVDVTRGNGQAAMYVFWSWGPDRDADSYFIGMDAVYDPTNGTISDGNIFRFGPY